MHPKSKDLGTFHCANYCHLMKVTWDRDTKMLHMETFDRTSEIGSSVGDIYMTETYARKLYKSLEQCFSIRF